MTETRTLTHEFTIVHATITYPGGNRTESIDFVNQHVVNDLLVFQDIDDNSWDVYTSSDIYLERSPHDKKTVPIENIESVDREWVEELTAVAEVEVTENRTRRLLRSDTVEYEVSDDFDVTIWERIEWEAHNS